MYKNFGKVRVHCASETIHFEMYGLIYFTPFFAISAFAVKNVNGKFFLQKHFSNSLIIHEEKTKEIIKFCELSSNFSKNYR